MERIEFPRKDDWERICRRPYNSADGIDERVREVVQVVRRGGDAALISYARQFDGVSLERLEVRPEEIQAAEGLLDEDLKAAIRRAAANIEAFHRGQLKNEAPVETQPGILCWRRSVGIGRVGLYIPGGSAPLFSTVLMLAIPARLAACAEIVLCSPPGKEGNLHPAILFAAALCGVTRIIKAGGAQAIAALAYGTESVPKVDKIFGPGNQYVTAAKQLVQQDGVAIDMPAGPSEVCVLADRSANPSFVAADLLSQAEHGPDSQVMLITDDATLVDSVAEQLERQLSRLPRAETAHRALAASRAVIVRDLAEGMELANVYAAEHLILQCADAETMAAQVRDAGSVFIGHWSPESVGDYASGTNHTLPTNSFARAYSGVSVDSFVKKITFQQLTRSGLKGIAQTVTVMAEAEGLQAHAEAVRIRLNSKTEISE